MELYLQKQNMETKISKLKRLLNEATDNHEQIVAYYFNLVLDKITQANDDKSFEKRLIDFMHERVIYANKFVGKKNSKVFEEEIYCLSLLSHTFLNGQFKPVIVENKVSLDESN